MPSWLLKSISDTMAPVIAAMCNASITQNKFPAGHKCAVVRPLLKKPTLDPSDLNSYRPISNLSFVSKILERLIDCRIADHANRHGLIVTTIPQRLLWSRFIMTLLVELTGHVGAIALTDLSSASSTI